MPNSRDHHREGAVVWTISWEFPIDPVTDTTETESNRNTYCEDICDLKESVSVFSRKKKNSYEYSEESTMKTHSSLPDREDLYRVLYKKSRIIEYDISKSSSDDNSEKSIEEPTIHILLANNGVSIYKKITKNEPKSIHEPIPRGSNVDAEK